MSDWFEELDLDPESTWRRMGSRALGDRPWLVSDDRSEKELALKADLFDSARDDVFVSAPEHVSAEVRRRIEHEGVQIHRSGDDLEASARGVQEDLCLLQHRDGAWHLDAAALCFPSRWRLSDKIGRPLADVHGPTPGYGEHLATRVDRLLDRLTDRPVLRRNWFVHPDASLHQPTAPAVEEVVPASDAATGLHLRSERQTLRKLECGWVLFTIRIQHDPLGVALAEPAHHHRFAAYVSQAPADDLRHRGMAGAQVDELLRMLGIARTRTEI